MQQYDSDWKRHTDLQVTVYFGANTLYLDIVDIDICRHATYAGEPLVCTEEEYTTLCNHLNAEFSVMWIDNVLITTTARP